jgi:hypothetical protein
MSLGLWATGELIKSFQRETSFLMLLSGTDGNGAHSRRTQNNKRGINLLLKSSLPYTEPSGHFLPLHVEQSEILSPAAGSVP